MNSHMARGVTALLPHHGGPDHSKAPDQQGASDHPYSSPQSGLHGESMWEKAIPTGTGRASQYAALFLYSLTDPSHQPNFSEEI